MKIETSTVTKLLITGAPNLDPITVFLEELPVYRGKMIVECYGRSWSAYWGSMGGTLLQFLKGVSTDYVAGCMFQGSVEEYDAEGLETMLKNEVLKRRFKRDLSQQEAYDLMYQIETSDFDAPYHLDNAMMVDLIGDDWHVCLPTRTTPDFAYLTRIIDAVRTVVAQTYPEKPDEKQ
jgi:hypothetical protein